MGCWQVTVTRALTHLMHNNGQTDIPRDIVFFYNKLAPAAPRFRCGRKEFSRLNSRATRFDLALRTSISRFALDTLSRYALRSRASRSTHSHLGCGSV